MSIWTLRSCRPNARWCLRILTRSWEKSWGRVWKPVPVDFSNENPIKSLIEQTGAKFGGINIVINYAGIINATPIASSRGVATSAEFLKVFSTNVFQCQKYAAQQMRKQAVLNEEKERSVIINVASVAGLKVKADKWFTEGPRVPSLAWLCQFREISAVTASESWPLPLVCLLLLWEGLNPKIQKALEDQITFGRLSVPREFGDCVVSLAMWQEPLLDWMEESD